MRNGEAVLVLRHPYGITGSSWQGKVAFVGFRAHDKAWRHFILNLLEIMLDCRTIVSWESTYLGGWLGEPKILP
jgi:hypothetical protein